MRGKFITLEGIDGAGKSSALPVLKRLLDARGISYQMTREPGGTPLSEKLREIVLNDKMAADTEALLVFAARAEHIAQVIAPTLACGDWVISDRFTDATFAYQGGGRGIDWQRLQVLERWTHEALQPDLTLLFDLSPEIARGRLEHGRASLDKFEREKADFFEAVRQGYLRRLAESNGRIELVQAAGSHAEVDAMVERILQQSLFP
jgi:dTMP kinase